MSVVTRRRVLTGATAVVAALALGSGAARATHTTTSRAGRTGVSVGAADLMYRGTTWRDARLDEAVHLGANWVRTDANWAWIEGTRGTDAWTELDGLVEACRGPHLRPLLLGTIPTWARPAGTPETHSPTTQGSPTTRCTLTPSPSTARAAAGTPASSLQHISTWLLHRNLLDAAITYSKPVTVLTGLTTETSPWKLRAPRVA
jgi:hypothetical protein